MGWNADILESWNDGKNRNTGYRRGEKDVVKKSGAWPTEDKQKEKHDVNH
jgi:hypothetical protein